MTQATPPIAVIGNANLDLVGGMLDYWPDPGTEVFLDKSDLRIGGSAANTAFVLQRLGARSGLISAAGDDMSGAMIRNSFAGSLDRIINLAGPGSVSFGLLHKSKERTFFSTRGHLEGFSLDHIRTALSGWPLEGAWVLVSGSFAMPQIMAQTDVLLGELNQAGASVAIDPGWPDTGWTQANRTLFQGWSLKSDLVLINDKELFGLVNCSDLDAALERTQPMLRDGARIVVKRGAVGATSVTGTGERHDAPAQQAPVFDTIGAGDAFNAGYLSALQAGRGPAPALAAACVIAGTVVAEFPRRSTPLTLPPD